MFELSQIILSVIVIAVLSVLATGYSIGRAFSRKAPVQKKEKKVEVQQDYEGTKDEGGFYLVIPGVPCKRKDLFEEGFLAKIGDNIYLQVSDCAVVGVDHANGAAHATLDEFLHFEYHQERNITQYEYNQLMDLRNEIGYYLGDNKPVVQQSNPQSNAQPDKQEEEVSQEDINAKYDIYITNNLGTKQEDGSHKLVRYYKQVLRITDRMAIVVDEVHDGYDLPKVFIKEAHLVKGGLQKRKNEIVVPSVYVLRKDDGSFNETGGNDYSAFQQRITNIEADYWANELAVYDTVRKQIHEVYEKARTRIKIKEDGSFEVAQDKETPSQLRQQQAPKEADQEQPKSITQEDLDNLVVRFNKELQARNNQITQLEGTVKELKTKVDQKEIDLEESLEVCQELENSLTKAKEKLAQYEYEEVATEEESKEAEEEVAASSEDTERVYPEGVDKEAYDEACKEVGEDEVKNVLKWLTKSAK